jgi:cell wall-associated NlpC family hydrolase
VLRVSRPPTALRNRLHAVFLASVVAATGFTVIPHVMASADAANPYNAKDVPTEYWNLYLREGAFRAKENANSCKGIHWSHLAGVGRMMSDHGRNMAVMTRGKTNKWGQTGPAGFITGPNQNQAIADWNDWKVDGNGDKKISVYEPADAIKALGIFLCNQGVSKGKPWSLTLALHRLNGNETFVKNVYTAAAGYRGTTAQRNKAASASKSVTSGPANSRVDAMIKSAQKELGDPYKFGGNGPGSWDCSALVKKAAASAGVKLPRTSRQQVNSGREVPRSQMRKGDLLFYKRDGHVYHVTIYLGNGRMIEAPRTGLNVRETKLRTPQEVRRIIG